jgi:hypothetical protein
MNFKVIKPFSLFLFIFVASSSFAQYKYDIGLKASTYEMERFQVEQRFHLNSPYSIVVTLAIGSRNTGNQGVSPYYSDSLFNFTNNQFSATNNALKIGVQRKLGFFATDVFYAGATIGIGFEQQTSRSFTATYSVGDSMPLQNHYLYDWEEINSANDLTNTNAVNGQLALSFGMDVPLSKRFSINAEIAIAGLYQNSLDNSFSSINMIGSFSGGLRYQFGKRE